MTRSRYRNAIFFQWWRHVIIDYWDTMLPGTVKSVLYQSPCVLYVCRWLISMKGCVYLNSLLPLLPLLIRIEHHNSIGQFCWLFHVLSMLLCESCDAIKVGLQWTRSTLFTILWWIDNETMQGEGKLTCTSYERWRTLTGASARLT